MSTTRVLDASAAVRAVMDPAAVPMLLLVHRFVDDATLFPEALAWSAQTQHPVYDALYALTARRHAATLLTCDRRLHAVCERSGIASECVDPGGARA